MDHNCWSCGEPVGRGSDFCPACGTSQNPQAGSSKKTVVPLSGLHRGGTASWNDLKGLLGLYTVFMAVSLATGFGYKAWESPWVDVIFSSIWTVLILFFLHREWPKIKRVFWFHRVKTKTVLRLLAACAMVYFFLLGYFALFDIFHWPTVDLSAMYLNAHWPKWSIYLMNSVEPGVTEEIAFRGIIQTRLSQILSRKEALIIQAALFSILHLSPMIFVSHFIMGFLLGWVRFHTRNVYFGMVLHMAWNAFVLHEEMA